MNKFKFSRSSESRLLGVHPDLVRVARKALEISDIDFGVSQGVRTPEEQKRLFDQGRNTPGPIVTWTLNSLHLPQWDSFGHAIDIIVYINGKISWEEVYYEKVSNFFKKASQIEGVPIKWGGDWKNSKDRPHYELNQMVYGREE